MTMKGFVENIEGLAVKNSAVWRRADLAQCEARTAQRSAGR
jgi:hypothetical protein